MKGILSILALITAFGAGLGILLAGQFGMSVLTGSIWTVPALALVVIGLIGLMPSLKEPEKRAGLFLLYGSLAGLAFITSSPAPPAKSIGAITIATATPILFIAAVIGLLICVPQFINSSTIRNIALVLAMGLMVVYFSGSSGGTGGGSWERWLVANLGVGLGTAEVLVIAIRKTIHFTFYGLLAFAAYRTARTDKARHLDAAGMAFFLAFSHSLFDEIRQTQTPDRTGQYTDVIIDMLGAVVFIWLGSRSQKQPVKRGTV